MLFSRPMQRKNVRLTKDVVPAKYELHLRPDLEKFVFSGEETIHLTIKKPTKTITLHAIELTIDSAEAITSAGNFGATRISYDEKSETATILFDGTLPKGTIELRLAFRGILNDKMHGFYRSSYQLNGTTNYLATTQFESNDARRAFPCFDEPAMKAIFEISLTVPQTFTAISNTMPVDTEEYSDGFKAVRFSPTPPMSTYLAAFIV